MPPDPAFDIGPELGKSLSIPPAANSNLASTDLGKAIGQQLPGAMQQSVTDAESRKRAADEGVKDLEATRAKFANMTAPVPPMPQRAPEMPHTDPVGAWGSLAMGAAMLGSAFTRQPMVHALNAAAGVMNAYRKRDVDAYKAEFDKWKAESDYGIKVYEYQRDVYRDAIDMIKNEKTVAEGLAKLRTNAAALGDEKMKALAEANNVAGAITTHEMAATTLQNLKDQQPVTQAHGEAQGEALEAIRDRDAARQAGDPIAEAAAVARLKSALEKKTVTGTAGGAVADQRLQQENDLYERRKQEWINDPENVGKPFTATEESRLRAETKGVMQGKQPSQPHDKSEVQYWVNVLQSGGHLPPGLSRTTSGSALVQEIMKVMAADPKMSSGDFIANAATVKADDRSLTNMTKMADAATSFERTASQNFDLALQLAKGDPEGKLPTSNPAHGRPSAVPTDLGPFFNRWIMNGETTFGDVDVPPYVTAMLTGANEYAKIMSGSTGAQGSTVDSRREAAELFSPYLSKGQIERVVGVAKADMGNRKQSLYGQIDDIKARLRSAGSGEPTAIQGQKPATVPAPVPSGTALPKITDQAAFDALPDGAEYLGPDGRRYKKGQR